MTLFFIQSPPPPQFLMQGANIPMELWGMQGGKTGGGKRGTLIWLMVLNNGYKERAGKVQHSSADTSVNSCKPQTPIKHWLSRFQIPEPQLTRIKVGAASRPPLDCNSGSKAGPSHLNATEGFQGHWREETASRRSWFILEAWAFEQVQ